MIEIVQDMRMSNAREAIMHALLASDPEAWASLSGAIATLDLPHVRHADRSVRQRLIEIQIDGTWILVDRVTFMDGEVVFARGQNGHSERWPFYHGAIPRWRMAEASGSQSASSAP